MNLDQITMTPIGVVHSSRTELRDDDWDRETVHIELLASCDSAMLQGLDSFSHCLVLGYLDQASEGIAVRHPRGNPDWPEVGILAQRAKDRPNRLGVSVCAIERRDDRCLFVRGLDFVDGTPVLDIKPWMAEFGPRGPVIQPQWSHELMDGYW